MIGLTISHYRITAELGHGGMGQVYRAQDIRLDRSVALKFLLTKSGEDRVAIERFLREARAASALNHPNIVTVHDIGETPEGRYLVMELVEGHTLGTLTSQAVDMESVMDIGRQVAKALAAAHASNIVHRDIKPENIMVRPDGYVKVLDFGVARRLPGEFSGPDNQTSTVSSPGTLVGTFRYMSPEQARAESVDAQSDIFSLGIVLFALATGRHPFASDSAIDVLHRIICETPAPASALNPSIPQAFESLLQRMMEKNPQYRPSAAEVDTILSQLLEAQGVHPAHAAPRVLESRRQHTVGRRGELEQLREALQAANSGRGLMLCLAGEPGMGKTTLVDEFLREGTASTGTWLVGRGRCSERLAGAEGYLPFLEALDDLVRNDPGQTMAQMLKSLAPGWYSQLSTSVTRESPTGGLFAETAAAAQQRIKRELGAFFEQATRTRPIVLWLDDLHWADLSTVDLLAYLGPKLPSMRLLLLGAYRSSELLLRKHPFLPVRQELQMHGICREVALGFLTRDDVDRYLTLEFPNHAFPPELPALIHSKTEGNPLFMVSLIRYWCDNRVIGRQAGPRSDQWVLLQELPKVEREVPESVRNMIQRKIDQLDPANRRLLAAATLQGPEFDSAVLSKALKMDPIEVEERLESIERDHAIIRRIGEDEHEDRTMTMRCSFVHALYQNALHDSLSPALRASLSGGVAQALEQFHRGQISNVVSQLALLWETARDFGRASEYFLLAAQNALRRCANQEGVAMARRGIEALPTLAPGVERNRRELGLQLALGMSSMAANYSANEVSKALGRARELCQELGENSKLLGVLGGLHGYHMVRSEHRVALELAREMLALAEVIQDPLRLAEAHYAVGASLLEMGNLNSAMEHFDQGITLADPHLAKVKPLHNPGVTCRCYASRALLFLGRTEEAYRRVEEALELSKQMRHPLSYTLALMIAAFLHVHSREPEQAEKYAEMMNARARDNGFLYLTAFGYILEGLSLSNRGNLEAGIEQFRKGLESFTSLGARVARPQFLTFMADTMGRLNQLPDALATVQEALLEIEGNDERYYEAEVHRVHGELLAKKDDSRAEESFRKALTVAQQQGARALELRAAISLASYLFLRHKKAEAREVLAPACLLVSAKTRDLADAKALLQALDEPRDRQSAAAE